VENQIRELVKAAYNHKSGVTMNKVLLHLLTNYTLFLKEQFKEWTKEDGKENENAQDVKSPAGRQRNASPKGDDV